jgi:hypothetical protein
LALLFNALTADCNWTQAENAASTETLSRTQAEFDFGPVDEPAGVFRRAVDKMAVSDLASFLAAEVSSEGYGLQ